MDFIVTNPLTLPYGQMGKKEYFHKVNACGLSQIGIYQIFLNFAINQKNRTPYISLYSSSTPIT